MNQIEQFNEAVAILRTDHEQIRYLFCANWEAFKLATQGYKEGTVPLSYLTECWKDYIDVRNKWIKLK